MEYEEALALEAKKNFLTESQQRLYDKLYHDLGAQIIEHLADKNVTEIMLNPDGSLWIDRLSEGQEEVGRLDRFQAFSILHSVAGIHDAIISQDNPYLEAALPYYKVLKGQRFTGVVPPLVSSPSFTIRKKSEIIFTLEDYLQAGLLKASQKTCLKHLMQARKNILVAGGPGSGKTTFTNALIAEAVACHPHHRFVILEDTPELQCSAASQVSMLTSTAINMQRLVRLCMRFSPSRILVGEVRGAEVLDMLKAWNTGCPGGICTVHANGCVEAIQRLLDLSLEAGLLHPPVSLVAHTVHAIVFIARQGSQKGFVSEIQVIKGYKDGKWDLEKEG